MNSSSFTDLFTPAASSHLRVTVVVAMLAVVAIKLVHNVNFNGEIFHEPFVYITSTLTTHELGLQDFPN